MAGVSLALSRLVPLHPAPGRETALRAPAEGHAGGALSRTDQA